MARLDRAAGLTGEHAADPATDGARPAVDPIVGERLVVDGIAKAFGGNQALDGASLSAEPGEVTALIGPNGSGKTTMLNMICGFYKPDSGRILVGDNEVQGQAPDRVARVGVARTFQTPNIPEHITVLEAVASGRYSTDRVSMVATVLRLPRYRRVRAADLAEAERALEMVGMSHLRDETATALPLGMRRLLEVARCVVAEPRVLLLDEVASGLDENEVERLADLIRDLRGAGATVVLVEHNFRLVLELANRIVVLAQGAVIADGGPAEIEQNPRVLSEYLGVSVEESGARTIADEEAALSTKVTS
ncbi:ABC transporter ATP-binding protein [Rhodococcus sp. NPDC055112]